MVREFTRLSDIYTMPDKEGNQKLVKKDVESKLLINLQDIRYVEHYLDKNGKTSKSKCFIKTVDNENILIKHKYEDVKKLVHIIDRTEPVGFKYKGRNV